MSTDIKKEDVPAVLDKDHPDYKKDDDEELEEKIPESIELTKNESDVLEEIKKAENPLTDEKLKVPHFDDSTKEFIDKINALPSLLPEHRDRLKQLDEDKRTVWILSHEADDLYPIRLYVVKEPTEEEKKDPDYIPQYETEKVQREMIEGNGKIKRVNVNVFKTETNYYPFSSMTPAAKQKIGLWEQQEQNVTMALQRLQQKYYNVITVRNLIDSLIEKDREAIKKKDKEKGNRITPEELKSYFKRLQTALDEIPKDFDVQIKKYQDDIMAIELKKTKALLYEHMAMPEDDFKRCVFSDARDYLSVAQRRDQVKPPT